MFHGYFQRLLFRLMTTTKIKNSPEEKLFKLSREERFWKLYLVAFGNLHAGFGKNVYPDGDEAHGCVRRILRKLLGLLRRKLANCLISKNSIKRSPTMQNDFVGGEEVLRMENGATYGLSRIQYWRLASCALACEKYANIQPNTISPLDIHEPGCLLELLASDVCSPLRFDRVCLISV